MEDPLGDGGAMKEKSTFLQITELLSISDQQYSAKSYIPLLARTLKRGWGRILCKRKLKELSSRVSAISGSCPPALF